MRSVVFTCDRCNTVTPRVVVAGREKLEDANRAYLTVMPPPDVSGHPPTKAMDLCHGCYAAFVEWVGFKCTN